MAEDLLSDNMTDLTHFYEVGKSYAITLNPDDLHQGNDHSNITVEMIHHDKRYRWRRLEHFRAVWYNKFMHMKKHGIEHYMEIELSPVHETNSHDSVPRLHFHGFIRFRTKNSIKFWLLETYAFLQQSSNIKLKQIVDLPGWISYITKMNDIMQTPALSNLADYSSFTDVTYIYQLPAKPYPQGIPPRGDRDGGAYGIEAIETARPKGALTEEAALRKKLTKNPSKVRKSVNKTRNK